MRNYIILIVLLGFSYLGMAQTITFNACHPIFDNQDFTFSTVGTDATGREIYETTPIDGQPCSGIGTCEFRLSWNDTSSQWELIADDGNGDFSGTYLIYSNTSASTPNPPSLALGNWVENVVVTGGACGGDGAASINAMSGEVQDGLNPLGLYNPELNSSIEMFPNPSSNVVYFRAKKLITRIEIFDLTGKLILSNLEDLSQITVSRLHSGMYLAKIQTNEGVALKRLLVK